MYKENGFIRVGAIVPTLKIGNTIFNSNEIVDQIKKANELNIEIVTTPELSVTGYTASDMFLNDTLIEDSITSLKYIIDSTSDLDIISIIGVPIRHKNQLFNTAVVINKGEILGIIPKTYIPNYNEFYEKRWFSSSKDLSNNTIKLFGKDIPFNTNIIFKDKENENISFAVEICEDLWCPIPPSINHTLNGASIVFNLSASNELIGKANYRKELVKNHSSKTISAYVYASSGPCESTSDLVFSGHSIISELGTILCNNKNFSFESNITYTDIDVKRIMNDRYKNKSFMQVKENLNYTEIEIDIKDKITSLNREYSMYPFVPSNDNLKKDRCEEIIDIQSIALARRLMYTNTVKTVIGMSGGLDSTLAFLVILEAYKKLNIDPINLIAVTMPGFGTTSRTYNNACELVKMSGATLKIVDIKEACKIHISDIGLDINDRGITYENVQARERTQVLMDIANKENGLVIGTGDLSELALGWCTYNGDHMSMYSVNCSIPKTLVRYLVSHFLDKGYNSKVLGDILDTPISPELLPPDSKGNISQITESKIGPYVLHDFFLYHFIRYGSTPEKLYLLAINTFKDCYSKEEIIKWLTVFVQRFFSQQFKRNCIPDGPKVGSISLSPRGDLRMPSEMDSTIWVKKIKKL